jgi:NADPH:quinone reductase
MTSQVMASALRFSDDAHRAARRTRNGSYAERVTVPVSNVAAVAADIDWEVMAAVPEVFATAWSALHLTLDIEAGQRVLVRGATSAVGQAAVQLAASQGCSVVATSRSDRHAELLYKLGAREVLIDDGALADQMRSGSGPVQRVLMSYAFSSSTAVASSHLSSGSDRLTG